MSPTIARHLLRARNYRVSWPPPARVDALRGAVLIRDGPAVNRADLAIARAILRTNPRLQPADALLFAGATARAARAIHSPRSSSARRSSRIGVRSARDLLGRRDRDRSVHAGDGRRDVGLDPYDPFASIEAAAALIGSYADAYRGSYGDPYSTALAAYNAGP